MRNRNVKIQVWLSKKEAENLQKKAKRSHISVAAYEITQPSGGCIPGF